MKRQQSGQSDHPGYGNLESGLSEEGRRRRWPLVAVLVFVFLLVGGAFAAYAYDDSRSDEIANGIRIGGVDVGGLEAGKAERLLRAQLVQPLRKPIFVTYAGRSWKLPAKQLEVRANLEESVDAALEESRDGGLPGRLVRYVTGGTVDRNIRPEVGYFQPALNRFVRRIAGDIDRDAQDATVSPTGTSLNVVEAQNGRELRDNLLEKQLAQTVTSATRPRRVKAVVRTTKPEVSTAEVASQYPTYITVDQASFTARVWKDLKLVREYTVAIGQPAYPTPYGLYSIANKQVDPDWSVPNSDWAGELAGTVVAGGTAANPLKARWMGITDGVGFHGTDQTYSLGTAASHGCLRMAVPDIIEMYDMVPVGTPVYIG